MNTPIETIINTDPVETKGELDDVVEWLIQNADGSSMWRVAWRLSQTLRVLTEDYPRNAEVKSRKYTWEKLAQHLGISRAGLRQRYQRGQVDMDDLIKDFEAQEGNVLES